MKHTPQDILEYLHWPENNFGDYFWDLRELVLAEIERRKARLTPDELQAYQWALTQDYQSVAARFAKSLAKALQRLMGW